MGIEAKYGVLTKDSSGTPSATDDIDLSFTPTALILWSTNQTATGFTGHSNLSFGFADGTNHYSQGSWSEDGQGTSDCHRCSSNVGFQILAGNGVIACRATVAFSTNKATLTWVANDTNATKIHYVALGGDIEAYVGNFLSPESPSYEDEQAITGVGFKPECILFTYGDVLGPNAHPTNGAGIGVGWTVGTAAGDQDAMGMWSRDNQSTSVAERVLRSARCIEMLSDKGGSLIATIVCGLKSFDADGFTLIHYGVAAIASYQGFLCLRGGQFSTHRLSTPTSTGTRAVTGAGFPPKVAMSLSANWTSTYQIGVHARMSVGGASKDGGTVEGHSWTGDTNGLSTTSSDRRHNEAKYIGIIDTDGPSAGDEEADLDSWDADGITENWTAVDAAERYYSTLLIGKTAAEDRRRVGSVVT